MSISSKNNKIPENILKIRKYFGNNLRKSDNKSLLRKSISQRFEKNITPEVSIRKFNQTHPEEYLFNHYLTMIIQNNEYSTGWEK